MFKKLVGNWPLQQQGKCAELVSTTCNFDTAIQHYISWEIYILYWVESAVLRKVPKIWDRVEKETVCCVGGKVKC